MSPEAARSLDRYQGKIGREIKRCRLERDWSQKKLAELTGLKQSHISRLEQGIHTPSDLTIQKLAKALGIDPSQLDPGL